MAPVRYVGFTIFIVNLVLHLLLVGVAFGLFWTGTRYSMLSNEWQAVAQLKAADTEELLEKATLEDGKTVKAWIDGQENLRDRRFRIRSQTEDERVCLS
ncbi:hypothetical protein SLS56_010168 [Neofusicoccum ribis]|uniref:Uncharacterized protein n=1 Tax=Neofusicoccum ribis TaxID=45134 RepID=A0ABR3SFJ1_9PEZI